MIGPLAQNNRSECVTTRSGDQAGGRNTAASIILSHGIPPIIVAGMLGHSLAILMTTYAHYIPGTQDEAARLMDEILTPIPIDLRNLRREKS